METVVLFSVGILIMVVGLALSIALHELGHFVPAKLFGVRVSQFMIGFGPTLFSRKRGETEFGIKAIPLGGYISMAGMFPPAAGSGARTASTGFFQTLVQDARTASADTVTAGDEHRTFYRLPVFKRIIIMLGGPFMNLVIAIVLYAIVLVGFGVAQQSTTIGSVSQCVLPATSERQDCVAGDPEAPGAAAGVLPGDTIVSIDGAPIETWEQATEVIRAAPDQELEIVVDRDGSEVALTAVPSLTERYVVDEAGLIVEGADGTPVTEEVGFVGIGAAIEVVQQPVSAVLPAVGDNILRVGNLILNLPQRLVDVANAAFGPEERDPNGPISVVGVGRVAGEIASIDTIPILERASALIGILASLNVALMVFNLVPLLPLDGGHVAGALFEGIRRFFARLFGRKDPGPVDTAKLVPLTLGVVVVLGAMSLLLIYADIVKPINIF
ncbi:M50 family metallopeptidase [Marisediminicola antarctica]|nr:site-2 protease family protein [Marisediminicola antarctica]